jgi:outer membrane protein assembly factor BamB
MLGVIAAVGGDARASAAGAAQAGTLQFAWRADLGRGLGARLACAQGVVVASALDRRVAAFDLQTGRKVWSVRTPTGMTGGIVDAPGVWLGVSDPPSGELTCLDANGGGSRWRRACGEVIGAPVVRGDRVFAATLAGRVQARSLADGALLWETDVGQPVRSALALDDSLIFVGAARDSLVALDARDGTPRWGIGVGGALYAPPLVAGERLYCVTYAGGMWALEKRTGARLASRRLPGFFRAGLGGPFPLVALSTAGRVCAVEPESLGVLWERELEGVAEWTPTLARGTAWIGLRDGSILGLDARDGTTRYEVRVTPPVSAPVLVDPGFVLIAGGRGELVAYRWSGGRESSESRRAAPSDAGVGGAEARAAGGAIATPAAEPGEGAGPPQAKEEAGAARDAAEGRLEPSRLAIRSLCSPARQTAPGGIARWRWVATAGWAACTALTLWMQREADDEYETYRHTGEAQRRDEAFSRARDYDRGVIGAWVAAEGWFVLGVRAWLAQHDGSRTP